MYFTERSGVGKVQAMTFQSHLFSLSGSLPAWHALLMLAPALLYSLAALLAGRRASVAAGWRHAKSATLAALLLAAGALLGVLAGSRGAGYGMQADVLGGIVLVLVTFVGWVIVRYSQPYLDGEPQQRHYLRWLLATLATVGVVIATDHVLVLALAWTATSLSLHRLLTFFADRPEAVVTAHKKFIVGRAADLCMFGAAALLWAAFGTLHISQLLAQATALPQLPWTAQAAVLLIACAALLKCAQLPFHGWLIQVMEAPTPVSALLHAGVVNLGGLVLMRFAPLVSEVLAAQVLLVAFGAATAVVASLVMTTRISVKVMLAWSTCAQMGFMLMQCGLGVWEMALLHFAAHSLYKAHAFLGAGGMVRRTSLMRLTPRAGAPGALSLALGVVMGVAMTLAAGLVWSQGLASHAPPPVMWVLAGIVALALVPLVHAQALRLRGGRLAALALGAFGIAFAYLGLHHVLGLWLQPLKTTTPTALWLGVALAFGALFLLQSVLVVAPQGQLARWLYPWFYGGLFLDEKFNRMAFGLWRPPVPVAPLHPPLPLPDGSLSLAGAAPEPAALVSPLISGARA